VRSAACVFARRLQRFVGPRRLIALLETQSQRSDDFLDEGRELIGKNKQWLAFGNAGLIYHHVKTKLLLGIRLLIGVTYVQFEAGV
jgi:hypothetical protein